MSRGKSSTSGKPATGSIRLGARRPMANGSAEGRAFWKRLNDMATLHPDRCCRTEKCGAGFCYSDIRCIPCTVPRD